MAHYRGGYSASSGGGLVVHVSVVGSDWDSVSGPVLIMHAPAAYLCHCRGRCLVGPEVSLAAQGTVYRSLETYVNALLAMPTNSSTCRSSVSACE